MRRILNQVLISKPDLLFFTSISAEELSCLKKLMGKRPSYPPVFVLMHGNLNAIYNTYSGKPWKSILTLRKALQMPDPEALYYLVLGESIIQTIREIPFLDSHKFQSMDIPYLWFNKVTHKPNPNKLHFGLLGVASKGLKEFSEIATRFKNEYPESKWSVVGYCNPRTLEKFTPPSFIQIHTQPLSLEEYIQYANQLDYILWIPHNPDDYKLSASATFLDALSLVKPGIYLSNRYIDYYFQKMGDIGYSAKDREELVQITHSLLSDFSHERYQAQLDTILRQRTLFDIATTSSQLREITKLSS
jgi:hypothetical protein